MTELHDLDKSLLLSIITQRYPMVDVEIADMILQTAHSMDSLVSNIKFMCDIEMDEKKIIMDYDQQSERDLDSPKPSENSPKSSKSNSRSRKSSKSSSPTISNAVPHASSDTGSLTALDDKSPKLDQKPPKYQSHSRASSPTQSSPSGSFDYDSISSQTARLSLSSSPTKGKSTEESQITSPKKIHYNRGRSTSSASNQRLNYRKRDSTPDSLEDLVLETYGDDSSQTSLSVTHEDALYSSNDFSWAGIRESNNLSQNEIVDKQGSTVVLDGNEEEAEGVEETYSESTSSESVNNEQSEDLTNLPIPEEEYQMYKSLLEEMCPDARPSDVIKALKESDYDPARASEYLLNLLAISGLGASDSGPCSKFVQEDDSAIGFLAASFPDIEHEIIESVLKANKDNLQMATDDLLTITAVSKDDIETEEYAMDPFNFLLKMFGDVKPERIKKALENNAGDVVLASDELLSLDLLKEAHEELQLHEHLFRQEEAERERKSRESRSQFYSMSGPTNITTSRRAHRDNIKFLVENYNLDPGDAKILYEDSNNDLALTCQKLEQGSNKPNAWNSGKKLTSLEWKVSKVGDFDTKSNKIKGYIPKPIPMSAGESSSYHSTSIMPNRSQTAPSGVTPATPAEIRSLQTLLEEQQAKRIEYLRNATEAYQKAKANPLYRSVAGHYAAMARDQTISGNSQLRTQLDDILASQTQDYSIDLHHLPLNYALDAAQTKLENWWTRESTMASSNPRRNVRALRIITGAGTHSVGGVPKIKNGVRKMLAEGNWHFVEHRAHFDINGHKKQNLRHY